MEYQMLNHNIWNSLVKANWETEVVAEEGDLVFSTGGHIFLVQRANDWNNVVCQKLCLFPSSFMLAIKTFQKVMEAEDIQYIRVEGNSKRYMFLTKMLPKIFTNKDVGIVKAEELKDRNVFYIKCF